ncbi:MAG: M10 family metallopeptidase [Pseudomonadota bacterium]
MFGATSDATNTNVPTDYTDAIDWGGQAVDSGQFNEDGAMIIEYSFADGEGRFGGLFVREEWTEYEKQQVEVAFDTYEAILNVEFVETDNQADAEFVLNKVDSFGLFLGVMNPPEENGAGQAGFAANGTGWDETGGLEQGGFGFITLIHEFGHGLGLAHPHDNGGGSSILPGVGDSDDLGDGELNQGVFTTMSYVDGWATNPAGELTATDTVDWGYQGTPMAIDIAVLQDRYGANEDYMTGDDVYILPDSNEPGTFYSSLWDAGGTDEIRHVGDQGAVIDLRSASLELEQGGGGWISYAEDTFGGFTIANGAVIENATGSVGNDALIGNEADNVLTGGGGNDTFVFNVNFGTDTITDFSDGDVVDLTGYGTIRRSDVDFTDTAEGFEVTLGGADTIIFVGLDRQDLSLSDFILA